MNKIERLIEKLCFKGVEWKTLGEIVTIERGVRVVRKQLNGEIGYPVYQNSLKSMGFYSEANRRANLTFVICAGAAGEVGFSDVEFWSADDCYTVDGNGALLDRYIYHFLLMSEPYLKSQVRKASIPRLSRKVIDSLSIPVPPLEVQSEIVQTLDNFAKLTAELTAELAKRKKQYEHYRDTLLSGDWPRVKLGEICEICDNRRIPLSSKERSLRKGLYRYYGAQGVIDYIDGFLFDGTYLLIAEDGENLRSCRLPIAQIVEGQFWVNNHAHIVADSGKANLRFLNYSLNAMDLSKYITGAAQPKLNQENLRNIEIPLPPLAEQERIVGILDKFDKLVNSLTEGLPAEIAAREKQYAYYRDKLLSFGKGE